MVPSPTFVTAPASSEPLLRSPAKQLRLNQSRCLVLALLTCWVVMAAAGAWLLVRAYEHSEAKASSSPAAWLRIEWWDAARGWWAGGLCLTTLSFAGRPSLWLGQACRRAYLQAEPFSFSSGEHLGEVAGCVCTHLARWRRTWWCCGSQPAEQALAVIDRRSPYGSHSPLVSPVATPTASRSASRSPSPSKNAPTLAPLWAEESAGWHSNEADAHWRARAARIYQCTVTPRPAPTPRGRLGCAKGDDASPWSTTDSASPGPQARGAKMPRSPLRHNLSAMMTTSSPRSMLSPRQMVRSAMKCSRSSPRSAARGAEQV